MSDAEFWQQQAREAQDLARQHYQRILELEDTVKQLKERLTTLCEARNG